MKDKYKPDTFRFFFVYEMRDIKIWKIKIYYCYYS